MLNSFWVKCFLMFLHVSNNPIQDEEEKESLAKGDPVENHVQPILQLGLILLRHFSEWSGPTPN